MAFATTDNFSKLLQETLETLQINEHLLTNNNFKNEIWMNICVDKGQGSTKLAMK